MDELIHQKRSIKRTGIMLARYILAGAAVLSLVAGIFWGFMLIEDLQRDYNEMGNYYDPVVQHVYHEQRGIIYGVLTGFFLIMSIIFVVLYWWINNAHKLNNAALKRSIIIGSVIEGILLAVGISTMFAFGAHSGGLTTFWIVHFPGSFMINMAAFLLSMDIPTSVLAVLTIISQLVFFTMTVYWSWLLSARLTSHLRSRK